MDMSSLTNALSADAARLGDYATNGRASVTDSVVEVTGPSTVRSSPTAANANSGPRTTANLHLSTAIVVGALVALWLLGGLVFKS